MLSCVLSAFPPCVPPCLLRYHVNTHNRSPNGARGGSEDEGVDVCDYDAYVAEEGYEEEEEGEEEDEGEGEEEEGEGEVEPSGEPARRRARTAQARDESSDHDSATEEDASHLLALAGLAARV